MQLLTDVFIIENLQVLEEGTKNGCMKVRGVFGRAEEENNNGRIYPNKVLGGQVIGLQDLISERRLCGELDHPSNETVKLSNASHLITKLEMRGNELMGEAEILKTPAGLTAQALINGGVKIGISSRGMGTLSEDYKGKKVVNEDYKLVTFDLVADPSTRGAYPGLAESTQSKFARQTQGKLTKEGNFVTMLESKLREAYQPWIEESAEARARYKQQSTKNRRSTGGGAKLLKAVQAGQRDPSKAGAARDVASSQRSERRSAQQAGSKSARRAAEIASASEAFELIKADGHWHRIAEALAVGFGKKKVDEGSAEMEAAAEADKASRPQAHRPPAARPGRHTPEARPGRHTQAAQAGESAWSLAKKQVHAKRMKAIDAGDPSLGRKAAGAAGRGALSAGKAAGRGAAAAGKGLMAGVKKFQQWRGSQKAGKQQSDRQVAMARGAGGQAPTPRAQQPSKGQQDLAAAQAGGPTAAQAVSPPADAGGGAQRGVIPRDIRAQGERRSAQQAGSKRAGREAEIAATTAAAQNAAQNPGDATAAQNRGVSPDLLARAKNLSPEQQAKIERMKNRKGADGTGTGGNKVGSKVRAGLQPGASITTPSYHTRPRSTHSAAAGAGARARAAGAATPAAGTGAGKPKRKKLAPHFGAGAVPAPFGHGIDQDLSHTAYQGLGRLIAEAMGLYEEKPVPTSQRPPVTARPKLTPEEQALADKRKAQKGTGGVERPEHTKPKYRR